jgi:hypothetical protein
MSKICQVWYCENPVRDDSGKQYKDTKTGKVYNRKPRLYCGSHSRRIYARHKKGYCEECGFIPKHMVQLDVDHIDGDKKNNDISNLMTLCANCHRYKTLVNDDYKVRENKPKCKPN